MKPINKDELELLKVHLESYLDSRLQKCYYTSKGFVLELYKNKSSSYLYISMNAQCPVVLDYKKIPFSMDKKNHPVLLFLKTHFESKRLTAIETSEKFERVLYLKFGYDDPFEIELRLFPHGQNIIATTADSNVKENVKTKKISFLPIKEMKTSLGNQKFATRTLEELRLQAFDGIDGAKKKVVLDPESIREKLKNKRVKSLEASRLQLSELENANWKKLGDFLVENQTLTVPVELEPLIDKTRNLSFNIENAFNKSKAIKMKLIGLKERIQNLESEISEIELMTPEDLLSNAQTSKFGSSSSKSKENQKKNSDRSKVKWKGYRYPIKEKLELFVGKNATENLNILRHAQSWDLWLHLKDYPGAHGIIRRPRNFEVSDADIKNAAKYVATHSKKSAHFLKEGDVFEVLVAECRFVRPIKGDKLGRVQYSDERVISVRL